ncbi:MAG: dihydropteroate synthase [Bacteroidota bacterium]
METVTSLTYKFGSREYDLSSRTYIMGILNVTPDSFSDGGRYFDVDQAISHGLQLVQDGADIIDIGGESTRPGSENVSIEEEIHRVVPVIKQLTQKCNVPISIDAYKHEVATAALDAGAVIVNDISGLRYDNQMAATIAKYSGSVVLMHIKGTPKTMQENPQYEDVVQEVSDYLQESILLALAAGIEQIIIDPGIGFGKALHHNLIIIQRIQEFQRLGYPVLVGPSRKSFIGAILHLPVDQRLEGTAGAVAASIMNGAQIIRVHDVKEMKRVAMVLDSIIRE